MTRKKRNKRSMSYTIDYENIGGNINKALRKRNKTQVWLADEIDVDKTHVNKWVKNRVRPSAIYLEKIASALDYDTDEIITGMFNDEWKSRESKDQLRDKIADAAEDIDK